MSTVGDSFDEGVFSPEEPLSVGPSSGSCIPGLPATFSEHATNVVIATTSIPRTASLLRTRFPERGRYLIIGIAVCFGSFLKLEPQRFEAFYILLYST